MCGAALSPRNVPEGSDGGACRSAQNHLWGMLTSRDGCAAADPRGHGGGGVDGAGLVRPPCLGSCCHALKRPCMSQCVVAVMAIGSSGQIIMPLGKLRAKPA